MIFIFGDIRMRIVHVTECLAGGVLTFLLNLTSQLDQDEHIIILLYMENVTIRQITLNCFLKRMFR